MSHWTILAVKGIPLGVMSFLTMYYSVALTFVGIDLMWIALPLSYSLISARS